MGDGSVNVEDDVADNPAEQLQADIADRMSALSEVVDTPVGLERTSGAFDSSDVDFISGSWMSRLADVQGWLSLDRDLTTDSADEFAGQLVLSLGLERSPEFLDGSGSVPTLRLPALSALYERLEQAVRLQSKFREAFEAEGGTREAASRLWNEAWDDEAEIEDVEPLKPVSAIASTWPISDFTDSELNLTPSYQRGDVWGTPARQMLIESILRGIPLPSVILLQPKDPLQPFEVVDGKQRLTAILRFVGCHPLALDRVEAADARHSLDGSLLRAFREDYPRFKKMWKAVEHEQVTSGVEDRYYFPFRLRSNSRGLIGPLAELQGKYYTQIKDSVIHAADESLTIKRLFERSPAYRIPVIIYKEASQSQIHEVFNLYNKQGMHLNAEEIRNAIYHELEITKATLVAAGDADPRAVVGDIAPSLTPVWPRVQHLGQTLSSYGFGESRYRRTKILSWIVATLLGDTFDPELGKWKDLPSTARHIDNLLAETKRDPASRLNQPEVVGDLFSWVADVARLHAAYDEELWSPRFKDGGSGQKWQELQLVGSLVGLAAASLAIGEDFEEVLSENSELIYAASDTASQGEESSIWARPMKTQTKTQWAFIARVALEIPSLLDVDATLASAAIRQRFGTSGLESLSAVVRDDER